MLGIKRINESINLSLPLIPTIRNRIMRLARLSQPIPSIPNKRREGRKLVRTVFTIHLNHSGAERMEGRVRAAKPGAIKWSERPLSTISTILAPNHSGVRVGNMNLVHPNESGGEQGGGGRTGSLVLPLGTVTSEWSLSLSVISIEESSLLTFVFLESAIVSDSVAFLALPYCLLRRVCNTFKSTPT